MLAARFMSNVECGCSDLPGISREGGRSVVWLAGEHDMGTVHAVGDALARAIYLDEADVIIDLRAVTFMDAATIGVLVRGRNILLRQSRTLTLRSLSASAKRVVELCGLTGFVESDGTDAAVSARQRGAWGAMVNHTVLPTPSWGVTPQVSDIWSTS